MHSYRKNNLQCIPTVKLIGNAFLWHAKYPQAYIVYVHIDNPYSLLLRSSTLLSSFDYLILP